MGLKKKCILLYKFFFNQSKEISLNYAANKKIGKAKDLSVPLLVKKHLTGIKILSLN
jgi:hypothetical protein